MSIEDLSLFYKSSTFNNLIFGHCIYHNYFSKVLKSSHSNLKKIRLKSSLKLRPHVLEFNLLKGTSPTELLSHRSFIT